MSCKDLWVTYLPRLDARDRQQVLGLCISLKRRSRPRQFRFRTFSRTPRCQVPGRLSPHCKIRLSSIDTSGIVQRGNLPVWKLHCSFLLTLWLALTVPPCHWIPSGPVSRPPLPLETSPPGHKLGGFAGHSSPKLLPSLQCSPLAFIPSTYQIHLPGKIWLLELFGTKNWQQSP